MCYGPELVANALDRRAYAQGAVLGFSRPSEPNDNAFMEAFNGRLREECLNAQWSLSLDDARGKIDTMSVDLSRTVFNRHYRPVIGNTTQGQEA